MTRDGLCLYHCLVAAADYAADQELKLSERVRRAEKLRRDAIALLKQHGLSQRARRLGLSGYDGYPDEEDFLYLAMASGISFEVEQKDVRYVPHYGTSPIAARVLYRTVVDGAGHESNHYDLSQV